MKRLSLCGAAIAAALVTASAAQAAPVLGSNVDSTVFSAAIGSTAGWSYMGGSTSAFSGSGTAELRWRSSSYANSFGYSRTTYNDRVTVFGAAATVGSTAAVMGYNPAYLMYFQADGNDFLIFSDDNRQFTDGNATGGNPGQQQGDIDIFFHMGMSKWAFFFDDAGGGFSLFGDDNDYDDMVVTFQQTAVPEPGALSLLGAALLGLFMMRRRQSAPVRSAV